MRSRSLVASNKLDEMNCYAVIDSIKRLIEVMSFVNKYNINCRCDPALKTVKYAHAKFNSP